MQIKTLVTSTITGLAVLFSTHAFSGQKSQPEKAIEGTIVMQAIGTVKSVDANAHSMTVETAPGTTSQWQIGGSVQDIGSIPIGSRVTSLDHEPVLLMPVQKGAVQEVIPGDKQFVLRVVSANGASGEILLKDASDVPFEVHTSDPQQAGKFAVGSLIKVVLHGDHAKK